MLNGEEEAVGTLGLSGKARSARLDERTRAAAIDAAQREIDQAAKLEVRIVTLLDSCTILMTNANTLVGSVHDHMAVILTPDAESIGIDPHLDDPAVLNRVLVLFPADATKTIPVGKYVNNARNDGPDCLTRRDGS